MKTRMISLWGKGGVGKSTLSLALGSILSSRYKTLVITTDPTPTLNLISRYMCNQRLEIIEMEENEVIELWKKEFGGEVYEVLSSFLPVEQDIIEYIANAPGISDEFILYKVYLYYKSDEYDYIIWDLPAASEALRLLMLEDKFYSHLEDATRMLLKIWWYLEKIRLKKRTSANPFELIKSWRRLAKEIFDMLRDHNHIPLLVSLPERVVSEYTTKLYQELKSYGIDAKLVILNMVQKMETGCDSCAPWMEQKMHQEEVISAFKKAFSQKRILEVPRFTGDVLSILDSMTRFLRQHMEEIVSTE